MTTTFPQRYARGRKPRPDSAAVKARKRGLLPISLLDLITMIEGDQIPDSWDSVANGVVGAVKDQGQCGCMPGTDEVLTEDGWCRWEDYDWQALLGTMNPRTGFLEFQAPLQQHVYDYDGPLYHVDHRSIDFALTPNHRLFLRPWNETKRTLDDNFKFEEVQNAGWYFGLPHATTGWLGTELEKLGVGDRVYQGDDFLAMIALLISDGWAGSTPTSMNQVSFCCFRDNRQDMVRALAYRVGFKEQPNREGVWVKTDGDLAEWLRQNAYTSNVFRSPNKCVPQIVKCASQRQIEHFLHFFGDQHIQEEGTRRFYSSSRRMIDDLQELLLRIGARGSIEERPPRQAVFQGRRINSNGPDLTLTQRRTDRLSLERKKHLRTNHFKGKVYCATVPNSTLVTRRNGTVLISGNSCWDFSGTGIVEIAGNVAGVYAGVNQFILSEQYTLDCGQNGGCNGDDNTTVLDWAEKTGLPLTADYGPYQGQAGQCKYTSSMPLYKISQWGFCDGGTGQGVTATPLIQAAIMKYGAVGCAVAAGPDWDSYTGGEFAGTGSHDIDHDVILVGWRPSTLQPGKVAWKMRNSWSASWGEGGYMWPTEGADDIGTEGVWCEMAGGPTPPTPPVPPVPPPAGGLTITFSGGLQAGATGTYTVNPAQTATFLGIDLTKGQTTPPWVCLSLQGILAALQAAGFKGPVEQLLALTVPILCPSQTGK